jgi:aminoglycoside phosphotransferase (APT) family kinase protein
VDEPKRGTSHPWHGWIAAVLPAEARRVRVDDSELAATLSGAGLELGDEDPDVEIAPPERLRGDAPCALVSLRVPARGERSRLVRVGKRIVGSLEVRRAAERARREVLRRGYSNAEVIPWDLGHPVSLPAVGGHWRTSRVAELLPFGAIVVGNNATRAPTLLEEAVEAARHSASGRLSLERVLVRATGLIVVGEREVMRVSVGAARAQLQHQRRALERLHAAQPPDSVAAFVPWPVAAGTVGAAAWSLERRLSGREASPRLGESLVGECQDFLVGLHQTLRRDRPDGSLSQAAGVVAPVCDRDQGEAIRSLAEGLEGRLADLPRGFGHGDFWSGNLLTEKGRLVGVVDWMAATADRLPLCDLIHLRLSARRWAKNEPLGGLLVDEVLPWARAGADERTRSYCERLGFEPAPERLEALVIAYWLDRVAHELETYSDRREPQWLRSNVEPVLRSLEHDSSGGSR